MGHLFPFFFNFDPLIDNALENILRDVIAHQKLSIFQSLSSSAAIFARRVIHILKRQ